MINVLIVGVSNTIGGIEKIFSEIYRNVDSEKIHFDFIAFRGMVYDQEYYVSHGSQVFSITSRASNPLRHYRELKKFFKTAQYDYVWVNTCSAATIATQKYAKKYTSAKVITHSHGASVEKAGSIIDKINNITDKFNRKKMLKLTDLFFACSMLAGVYLFGEAKREDIILIKNGIDVERYAYSQEKRNIFRERHDIKGLAVGFIGRITIVKNPIRMVEIFSQVAKLDKDAVLVMAGDGMLMDAVKQAVLDNNLSDNVRLLGNISNVDEFMSGCDVLTLPSFFEGLPIVAIEAQCSGLSVVMSNAISEETKLLDSSALISLDEDNNAWANTIINAKERDRSAAVNIIRASGYEIVAVAKELEKILI